MIAPPFLSMQGFFFFSSVNGVNNILHHILLDRACSPLHPGVHKVSVCSCALVSYAWRFGWQSLWESIMSVHFAASVPLSPLPVWFLCGSYPSLGAEMVRDQVQKRLVSLPDSTVTQGVRVIQTPQGAGLHFMSCIWMKIRKNHLPLLQSRAVGFRVSWWADVFKIMCVGFINWTSIHGPLTKAKASRTRYPVCLSQALHRTWTYEHMLTYEHMNISRGALRDGFPTFTVALLGLLSSGYVSGAPRFSVSLPAPFLNIYTEYIFTLGSVFTSSRLGPYPPSWVSCLLSPHLLSHGTYLEAAS